MSLLFYSQPNFTKNYTRLLLQPNLFRSLYRAQIRIRVNFSFTDHTCVRHRRNGNGDYYLFIESICQMHEKHTAEPCRFFADIFDFSIFLASIDRFCDWLLILLSTCMTIFSYDLSLKFSRAGLLSTGTTLLLTPKCLLAYIKRTMYKRSNTPIASFSSGSKIFASYSEI